jgi:hypothetical protein
MSMMHRLSAAAIVAAASLASPLSAANASDQAFFRSVEGIWKGPGEIVAGKYRGTKFNCHLGGAAVQQAEAGITLDGTCRVGVFNQKMTATITRQGSRYVGTFLDGAKGDGLDIVSGRVEDDRVVVAINRQQLDGAMVARMMDPNTMNVTVSVKVGETMVPVIGMTLARDLDAMAVGAVR